MTNPAWWSGVAGLLDKLDAALNTNAPEPDQSEQCWAMEVDLPGSFRVIAENHAKMVAKLEEDLRAEGYSYQPKVYRTPIYTDIQKVYYYTWFHNSDPVVKTERHSSPAFAIGGV